MDSQAELQPVELESCPELDAGHLCASPQSAGLDIYLTPSDSCASESESEKEDLTQHSGSDIPQSTIVSLSTTFHPLANLLPIPTDVILVSSDEVHFFVHSAQILGVSSNQFNNAIELNSGKSRTDLIVRVPEPSAVLNVILHCVYGLSCAQYKPTLDVLTAAVDAMPSYGLSPKTLVSPATALYNLILAQAPIRPLHIYALASRHDLYELAQPVSSYLLSFPLHAMSPEEVDQITPVYLTKLYALHARRREALKLLLFPLPGVHAPTAECDFVQQKKFARAWSLATASVAWEARADLPPSAIEHALLSLADHLSCDLCKQSLADRVKQLLAQWSFVQRTI